MRLKNYQAVILDLDGVVTQTVHLHAKAWKHLFDAVLYSLRGAEEFRPFDLKEDYYRYVDGKSRYQGVQSFLASRGIELPMGEPEDEPGQQTIYGLGKKKNNIFKGLLEIEGVQVYEGTRKQMRRWRKNSLQIGVVTSSKNGRLVLQAAGLSESFDVILDGHDLEERRLRGKPQPDLFLEAARELNIAPQEIIVVEDSLVGVRAGQLGQFGLVLGIDRQGIARELKEEGADIVLSDLDDFNSLNQSLELFGPKPALTYISEIRSLLMPPEPVLFFDYDGTLTPIVRNPWEAVLSDNMRSILKVLSQRFSITIVSGRDRDNVEQLVGLESLNYAGSHGFDIKLANGSIKQFEGIESAQTDLEQAEKTLKERTHAIDGVLIERKKFAVAVHYRNVHENDIHRLYDLTQEVAHQYPSLIQKGGKKIFELKPAVDWHKGKAVFWILENLGLNFDRFLPLYFGDDLTDEDAFVELRGRGLSFLVGEPSFASQANFYFEDQNEIIDFLMELDNWREMNHSAMAE